MSALAKNTNIPPFLRNTNRTYGEFAKALKVHPKLRNINPCNVIHSWISRNPRETDFYRSNLTHCCHISLPEIAVFVINVNHHRSKPTSSYRAMCQYVECLLRIPYSSPSSYVTCWFFGAWICHVAREGQVGDWHVKMDHVLWSCRFTTMSFVLNPKP